MPEDQQPEPQQQQTQEPAPAPVPAPPWGNNDEFNPEKAWKLIQDLRADKEKLASRTVLTDEQKQQLAEYDRLVEAGKTELERANEEKARWQSEADRWRASSVSSRIEALATADFADPSDAVGQLDPAQYVDSGGVINDAAIKADLAEILVRKPHWARVAEPVKPRVPSPNPNQGSGGGGNPALDPRQEFAALLQSGINRTA